MNYFLIGGIVVGAIVAFWLLHKIVKFVLSLVIVLLIAAAAVFYCVKAGYLSAEDAEKMNPLNHEQVRESIREAGAWAGAQAQDAARRATRAVAKEVIERLAPTNAAAQ